MALPIGVPMVIGAVKALVRYRARVDQILALKEATESIPFALPPAPIVFQEHRRAIFAYFSSEPGRLILELRGLVADFEEVKARPTAQQNQQRRTRLLQVYFEFSDDAPVVLGPESEARSVKASAEMRLAYNVVASHRLARNPVLTRLLLATSDTLLEVAGENVGLFVSNPKTQAVLSTLIDEFAIKRDFDDDSGAVLFKNLLRSATIAAIENQSAISDEPLAVALFGALSDVRKDHGDDFVAKILTTRGFQGLVGKFFVQAAQNAEGLIDDDRLRGTLAAMLDRLGSQFPRIVDDPRALLGVLEVGLTEAASELGEILDEDIGGNPLLDAVLVSVLEEMEELGRGNRLMLSITSGDLVSEVFRTSLATVARDPGRLASATGIDELTAHLLAGVADVVAHKELTDGTSEGALREILRRSLLVLADNSSALARDSEFAARIMADVLKAASSSIEDGLSTDDLATLLDAAIGTATENIALSGVDGPAGFVLESLGAELSSKGVRTLLSPEGRGGVILATVEAVSRNPRIWKGFSESELVQPLVSAALQSLAAGRTDLMSESVFVEAVQGVLAAVALRGQAFLDREVDDATLRKLLSLGIRVAEQEVGRAIDGDNLAGFLERLVTLYLAEPFELDRITSTKFRNLADQALGLVVEV